MDEKLKFALAVLAILLLTAAGAILEQFGAPGAGMQNGFTGTTPAPTATPSLAPAQGASPTTGETPVPTPTPQPTATPEQTPTHVPLALPTADDILSLGVHTDKEIYHTSNEMSVIVTVNSTRQFEGIQIWIYGMVNSRQMMYLNHKYPVTLQEGENEFTFEFIVPSCSSCSGISYGVHSFDVMVLYEGNMLKNATTAIEIHPN